MFIKKKPSELSPEELTNTVAAEAIKEIRANRRSSMVFRFCILLYALLSGIWFASTFNDAKDNTDALKPHAAVVDVLGPISRKGGVNAYKTIEALEKAFNDEFSQLVILNLDSPGGSPAQSDVLYMHILKLKAQHDKKVVAVIGDICASGCVFIASAADEILLSSATSIYGNIGVRMEMFNVHQLMKDLKIGRTSVTAGEHKTLLDPFKPNDQVALDHLQTHVVDPTYERFKQVVREGRKDRLIENDKTFSGLVWVGQAVIDQGLADGYGDLITVSSDYEGGFVSYSRRDFKLQDLVTGTATSIVSEVLFPKMGM